MISSVDADDLVDRGCDLVEAGQPEKAAACFARAEQLGSAIGAFNLGNTLRDLGRTLLAVDAYERAIAGGEDDARLNMGLLLVELGDVAGGTAVLRSGAAAGANGCALALAFELREQGERDAAEEVVAAEAAAGDPVAAAVLACWRWCRTWDPELEPALRVGAVLFPSCRADLADLLVRTDRLDEALAELQCGAELGEVVCILPLGNLHWDGFGDVDAAELAYRAGVAAGDLHCRTNLGLLLLEERDDRAGAEVELRRASDDGDALAAQHLRRHWGD
jgi:tetratricopeptide (TPR) repeat protein